MKKCPFCNEWNSDEAMQCQKCHEWFELETIRRKKKTVKSSPKGQSKKESIIKKGKKKRKKTWQEYSGYIAAIVLFAVIILFITSHKTEVNKKEVKQSIKIETPVRQTLAAPASKPDVTPMPRNVIELYHNAVSLCSDGKCTDPPKAIEYLNEVIHLRPNFAAAYGVRGNAYYDQKEYELALEDYNEAIRIKPDVAMFFNNRGNVFKELHQYETAIADYNQAILLKPDYALSYHNRGIVYLIQGNKELGCLDAQKACEYGACLLLEFSKEKKYCP